MKYPARGGARSLVLLRGCASTVCDAVLACAGEPVAAGLADGITSAFVLVAGGDVADGCVQPDGVVLGLDVVQLGVELAGVADLLQVRPLALDVANRVSIHAWSCGVCGRPNCWAIATPARNSRVDTERICGPVSLMASSSGICPSLARPCAWSRSPLAIASRSAAVARSSARVSRSSASRAARKQASTWVEVSSALVRVASHLRETTSRIAIEARLARVQWVKS